MRAGWLVIPLALAAGCVDFELDDRRFRCNGDSSLCAAGELCAPDGFCAASGGDASFHDAGRADAALTAELCDNGSDDDGDGAIDCLDTDCGVASCDDDNPCTSDSCEGTGLCGHTPVAEMTACGAGCTCDDTGVQTEVACGDGSDNDRDDAVDCRDTDCPACTGGLMCCADGMCRPSC